jgi:hypothetical protein
MDGTIKARIHFAEKPENEYLQKLIDGCRAAAVTWDIQGLTPNATFEIQIRYLVLHSQLIVQGIWRPKERKFEHR